MTRIRERKVRCALCGRLARITALEGAPSEGPPDLDLRPNGPLRATLPFQVQRCVGCGYCWHSIGEAPPVAAAVVASELYRDVADQARMPMLARAFFCAALVAEAAEETEASAWTFMYAAWACDDGRAMVQARVCRERAVEMFRRGIEWGELSVRGSQAHTLVAEVLRRAGRFEDAVTACDEAARARSTGDDSGDDDDHDPSRSIDAFIRSRAEARDDHLYTVAEAFAHED